MITDRAAPKVKSIDSRMDVGGLVVWVASVPAQPAAGPSSAPGLSIRFSSFTVKVASMVWSAVC